MATVINSGDCIVWTKWATPQRLKQFKENKIILFLTKIFRPFTSKGMRMAETYDNTPFCKSFTVVLRNRCRPTSLLLSLSYLHFLSLSFRANLTFIRSSLKKAKHTPVSAILKLLFQPKLWSDRIIFQLAV